MWPTSRAKCLPDPQQQQQQQTQQQQQQPIICQRSRLIQGRYGEKFTFKIRNLFLVLMFAAMRKSEDSRRSIQHVAEFEVLPFNYTIIILPQR